jgi:magnesium transporter
MTTSSAVTVVEFDFENRRHRLIACGEIRAACDQKRCCWVDIDLSQPNHGARAVLETLGVNPTAIDEALSETSGGRCDSYDDCLHISVATPVTDRGLRFAGVNMILGERFIATLRPSHVDFMEIARRSFPTFFQRFAQSLGFLLFEFWDHLIDSYRKALHGLEVKVDQAQHDILAKGDEPVFQHVADITHELLALRRNIVSDREVLEQLAVRRSNFVSQSTQPYLSNMVGSMDRLASDLTVARESLAETLNLHLGIVSHRTNRVVSRLTIFSVIFLPLTFLCGVYGMNFTYLPEKEWPYGYFVFWIVSAVIAGGLWLTFRAKRWI